jgi:C4-dicarboxylate-specific signal transduction histidine kinase
VRYVEERGGAEYTAEGEPSYMTGTVQDITARKEAEDHVRELNENLEARVTQRTSELALANDDLHEAMKDLKEAQGQLVESEKMASLGGLVAGVAHEINTPVGVGVTAASHLSEATRNFQADYANGNMKRRDLEKFVETAAHSTEIISGNLHRASELIRSFKQVAVDQSSDDRRTFKAREYLDEIVNSLKPRLKKTKHQIIINCDDSLVIDSFPGAWSQILTNLIMNSVIHAFDEDDSGVISVDMATDKKGVMLCYSDDGKGMPEDLVARVFEPFFTTKRGAGGSGLGMHILFNLVTAKLGGVVECTSEVGKGTTFTIATPLPKGQKDDRNAA